MILHSSGVRRDGLFRIESGCRPYQVVEIPALRERTEVVVIQAQLSADRDAISGETLAVAVGLRIARLDRERETSESPIQRNPARL
jgi:hypothetical protein